MMLSSNLQSLASRERAQTIVERVREVEHQGLGAGLVYELYEERRIEYVRSLLDDADLSTEDHDWVCRVLGYDPEDDGVYVGRCEECGAQTNADMRAQSVVHTGQELCRKCLVDAVL